MKKGSNDDLLESLSGGDDGEEDNSSPLDDQPDDSGEATRTDSDTSSDIPYLLRRNRVKEGRETVGFGLQKETRDLESEVLQDVKTDLDVEKLATTDLREAAYLAGLQNPERVKQILLEWGYEHRR